MLGAKKAWNLITVEIRGMHRAAYVLGVAALSSSFLAFLRDRLLAHEFGTSRTLDVYYASFRIPDLIFVTVAALVSAYVIIPELAKRTKEEEYTYIDTVVAWYVLGMVIVSGVAFFAAPTILKYLFPSMVQEGLLPQLTELTRILLLQPFLLGLSNIFAAITQSRHRYALYAVTPLLYNVGIIIGILFFYPHSGVVGLVWGVVLGSLMHLAIQLPSVFADGFFSVYPKIARLSTLKSTVSISVPRALALSMSQLAYLGLIGLAGALTPGSISVFVFAYNLQAAPLTVIGASYSVAAFPRLAHMFSKGEHEEFLTQVSIAARHIFFWSVPAIALVVVLRAYIVRIVLGSGAFDWTATKLTAASLALLIIALAAQSLTLLLIRGYYAAGKTFVPFWMSAGTAGFAVLLGYASIHVFSIESLNAPLAALLRVSGAPGSNVLALSFAYALASILGALFLTIHFERTFPGFYRLTLRTFFESVFAAAIGGLASYLALVLLGDITPVTTTLNVCIDGTVAGIIGLLAVGLSYRAIGSEEFAEATGAILRKVGRAQQPVISVEDVAQN